MISNRTEDSPRAPQKVVYFIASHVHPDQIVRLVRACLSGRPGSRVLLHHDYRVSDLDPSLVEHIPGVDLVRDWSPVGWGGFAQCEMILRSMRWLSEHREFDWVVYLSGQCYPIQPLDQIEAFLDTTPYDGFTQSIAADEHEEWSIGPGRYLYRYYRLPRIKGIHRIKSLIDRRARAARSLCSSPGPRIVVDESYHAPRIGIRPLLGPFRHGFRPYVGSSWWTLNRRCIEFILRYEEQNPGLKRHYRRVKFAPNESFFHTILRNQPDLKLQTDNNLRYITWSHRETGHPDLLRASNYEPMAASGHHFCRKVDQRVDPMLLDLLDRRIGIAP